MQRARTGKRVAGQFLAMRTVRNHAVLQDRAYRDQQHDRNCHESGIADDPERLHFAFLR